MRTKRHSAAFLSGSIFGGGLIATADAGFTELAPLITSFIPISIYLGGMLLFGIVAAVKPGRGWHWLATLMLVVGVVSGSRMLTLEPRWDSKIGWRACRLIAGPFHLRSPYPVGTPGCGILSMCANETRYDMMPLIKARGCPAP